MWAVLNCVPDLGKPWEFCLRAPRLEDEQASGDVALYTEKATSSVFLKLELGQDKCPQEWWWDRLVLGFNWCLAGASGTDSPLMGLLVVHFTIRIS